MKDDAAKALLYIVLCSFGFGLLVLGGFFVVAGEAYTPEYCLRSNVRGGFYPYNPPTAAALDEDKNARKGERGGNEE